VSRDLCHQGSSSWARVTPGVSGQLIGGVSSGGAGVAFANDPAATLEPVENAGHGGGVQRGPLAWVLGLSGP
jgi:hypothetical protein